MKFPKLVEFPEGMKTPSFRMPKIRIYNRYGELNRWVIVVSIMAVILSCVLAYLYMPVISDTPEGYHETGIAIDDRGRRVRMFEPD